MVSAIHPLQVFTLGFRHWQKSLWQCAGIVAALYGPFLVLAVVAAMAVAAAMQAKVFAAAAVLALLLVALGVFVFNAAPAAVILASMQSRQGRAGIIGAIRAGSSHALRVCAVNLLGILALGGAVALTALAGFLFAQTAGRINTAAGGVLVAADVLAGICLLLFLAVRLSLAVYVCVLEGKGPLASVNRSFTLTRGRFFPMAGVFLLCIGAGLAVFSPAMAAAVLLPKSVQQVPQIVMRIGAELFLTPFFINVSLMLFDRIRPAETKQA